MMALVRGSCAFSRVAAIMITRARFLPRRPPTLIAVGGAIVDPANLHQLPKSDQFPVEDLKK